MGTLEQKVVLITGTGGGMGRVASLIFAREGAKVVGCDIQVDANEETVELVRRAGGEMTGIAPIDLTDPQQAQRLVEDAVAAYGGLDVVYNNAASLRFGSMPDFSVDDWRATVVGRRTRHSILRVEVRMAAPGPARWRRHHQRRVHGRHDRRMRTPDGRAHCGEQPASSA